MKTGLLGGSFNPAHRGHRRITLAAIRALDLDEAWWLVSPGNPLKADARDMAPLAARLASARRMARRAPIRATDIEARLHTRYTLDTLRKLRRRYPRRQFVWLMGADNLVQFHRWRNWRGIMTRVPVAVMARPGAGLAARMSVAARAFRPWEVARAEGLGEKLPPAWCFVNMPLHGASSTAIRARGEWRGHWKR